MSIHTLLTQQDKDGNDYTVYEAAAGTYGAASGKRWYICHICGLSYREDKVKFIGGAPYCVPLKCYEEGKEAHSDGQV
jgi:hypothetical protein